MDFQVGSREGHLGLPIRTILSVFFFNLQVNPIFPIIFFESIGLLVQEKKLKNIKKKWRL